MISMQINKKRILSPQRYLYALNPDEPFYLAARLMAEDVQHLLRYGIKADGNARIPTPRGPATATNADGKWVACRDLPKEERDEILPAYMDEYELYPETKEKFDALPAEERAEIEKKLKK